jgi:exonuclease VII small subunit
MLGDGGCVVGSPGLLADCHSALSDVHWRRGKLDEAQASLERAVQLHRQAQDVLGEANDVQKLGVVHLRRDKLDEAQVSFERAIELHRQAQMFSVRQMMSRNWRCAFATRQARRSPGILRARNRAS